jgi:hypothetical protein
MGDGVDWIATRWRTVFSQIEKPFAVQVCQRFTLDLDNDESVRVFVSHVLAVRAAAAQQKRHLTGWKVPPFSAVEPCKVLAVTGSCVVAECRTNAQSFALKIRSPINSTRCEQEAFARMSLGLNALLPSIARCSAVDFFGVRPVLQLDVVGTVLEDMCLCDDAARLQLARVVYHDVRVGLQWLHELKLAFVDLHPGNIVISSTGRAFLIDLESSSKLGEPTTKPIRAAFRTLGADNAPTRDTDSRGLLLVLAWILDIQAIRSAVARVDSRDAGADKAAAVLSRHSGRVCSCSLAAVIADRIHLPIQPIYVIYEYGRCTS